MNKIIIPLLLLLTVRAPGVINPRFQPKDLRYETVLNLRVREVNTASHQVVFDVAGIAKGAFAPTSVTMSGGKEHLEDILSLEKGQSVVAFAGKKRPRSRKREVLYYAGGGKAWIAQMGTAEDPSAWTLVRNYDDGLAPTSDRIFAGTFNGRVESLWQMMLDLNAGTLYFPAVPFTRFEKQDIGRLAGSPAGVGIHEIDGDGRLDLFAASPGGCRLFLQTKPGEFEDRTAELGLQNTSGKSCSFADVDGDGAPDLLVDGAVHLLRNGEFQQAFRLGDDQANIVSSAFADLNRDGHPDVLLSRKEGGLALLQHSGTDDIAYLEKTGNVGLDLAENGGLEPDSSRSGIGTTTGESTSSTLRAKVSSSSSWKTGGSNPQPSVRRANPIRREQPPLQP